jgi:pilus assembly protein CpaF
MELHERLGRELGTPSSIAGRDPFTDVKNKIHLSLVSDLGPQLFDLADSSDTRDRVVAEIRDQLQQEPQLSRGDRERLAREIADDIFGYGPLEPLIADQTISEIMVNGHEQIWIERDGKISETNLHFDDDAQLRRIITKMVGQVGRRIDESSPMVDARLPDGSRVNAIISPLSLSGPLLTIRRFSAERYDLEELTRIDTVTAEVAEFLSACIRSDLNILISGGTGTGKTTFLNALSAAVPSRDRIVTIEDAAELQLKQRHTVRLESRPKNIEGEGEVTIRDLVRNALRMRPDRIIVGEVRGGEALDMLQAMNTGHEGSLSTIHANSPRDALNRLETMVLMAGFDLPVRAIRHHVSSALDLVVQLERMDDGSRHVTAITEVQRMESEVITLQDLFAYKVERIDESTGKVIGQLRATGLRPTFLPKFERHGIQLPPGLFGDMANAMYGVDGDATGDSWVRAARR